MKVAAIQQKCGNDHNRNLLHTEKSIRKATENSAKLIVLQELHKGEYFCKNEDHALFDWAESIPGPTSEKMAKLAKELDVVIVSSIFERRGAGIYHNTAVVLETDGSIAGIYRKMHIPDDPSYYEKFYFTPGDLGFIPIHTSVGLLGVLVCWDQWFPEAARIMALQGAEILIYPSAIGWSKADSKEEQKKQRDAWITIQRSHAISNGIPIIVANRVGYEKNYLLEDEGLNFWGSSFIAGPQGEMIAEAPTDQEHILIAEIDMKASEDVRRAWPFFRDRRIDSYSILLKKWGY
ncbi:MAG: carbon-nitrogen hydrolase [Parachlamydiaceae bacterium]|nr:carbon-nitrogen hydrolase [Parachlamydiaceae bacterium]